MAINWQKGTLFAGGLALGVAAGVWGVMSMGKDKHAGASPPLPQQTSTMGAAAATAGPAPLVAVIAAPPGTCEQSPVLAKSADGDGRETLQTKVGTATASEVASMILGGKEAAASGRPRDAEVFFLNACRNAATLQGKENIAVADAMYQLGRLYANVAALSAAQPRQLYERAERLYTASLAAYTTRYGATHEKTKFAQAGLTTVLQATHGSGVAAVAKAPAPAPAPVTVAQAPAPTPAPAPAVQAPPPPVVQAPPAPKVMPAPTPPVVAQVAPPAKAVPTPAPRQVVVQAAPPVAKPAPAPTVSVPPPAARHEAPRPAAETQVARKTSPSFDCARARSTTEKLICGDEELARMDRELGGMHQRAKQAAADPRAFQRASDAEWKRREETCRDADCLRRWYAQRRQDLSTASAAAPAPRTPRVVEVRPAEAPVAQATPRQAELTPVRPRAREIAPDVAAPRMSSGDSGIASEATPRPRRSREVEIAAPAQAEGSPNAD